MKEVANSFFLVNEKVEWLFPQLLFVSKLPIFFIPHFNVQFLILSSYLLLKNITPLFIFVSQVAKSCFVPVLFGHAIDDDFICPYHSDRIFEAYIVSSFHLVANIQNLLCSIVDRNLLFLKFALMLGILSGM